jgi:hypothetical protein
MRKSYFLGGDCYICGKYSHNIYCSPTGFVFFCKKHDPDKMVDSMLPIKNYKGQEIKLERIKK